MNLVQLYIGKDKLDLFNDEDIVITSTIQNAKDISKIFTDFSQSFTIPASPTNNKKFKHFYNVDIATGYNYDGRKKIDAEIEINHSTFRKGKIRLDGVQLKENKPYAYKITFFGNTVTLPDLLGEDLLSDLTDLDAYDHEYSEDQVRTGLQSSLVSGNIIYPLISHTQRFFYDSSSLNQPGNLYYDPAYPNRGCNFKDLKPAIKLSAIIGAIETQYGLTFDSEFFDGTLTGYEDVFPNLFLWLHAKKGEMQAAEGQVTLTLIKNFLPASGSLLIDFSIDGSTMYLEPYIKIDEVRDYSIALTVTPVEAGDYTIYIYKDNELLASHIDVSGTFVTPDYSIAGDETVEIYAKIETANGITNYDAEWEVQEYVFDPVDGRPAPQIGTFESNSQSVINEISIRDNIPNVKVMDFLSSIFRTFNLTSYVKQTGEIYVEPLNTFYEQGTTRDISQFVDLREITVDRAIPYRTMNFKFPESKTFHAQKRNQIFGGTQFGDLVYTQKQFDGTDYSLEVRLEKMLFEKISDENTGEFTQIGWGWSVDYNGDSAEDIQKASSVVGEPLIFFNIPTTNGSTPISFYGAGHNSLAGYNRPGNVNENETQTLNFNAEIDEYNLVTNDNSLYKRYYETYISQIFDVKARVFTYDAVLPNNLLLNYSVNDTFIIGDRKYIISTVKTNTKTGKTRLELINKLF